LIMDGEPLKTVTNDREVKRGDSKGAGVSKPVCCSELGTEAWRDDPATAWVDPKPQKFTNSIAANLMFRVPITRDRDCLRLKGAKPLSFSG
jgi:hypothetical protein